jgi:uncharacterized protein (TIGR02611 family)
MKVLRRRKPPEMEWTPWGDTSTLRMVRKLVVLVLGGTVVLLGVALIVLPGPAFLVIPAGLAILATEFVWARRLLRKVRERVFGPIVHPPPDPKSSQPGSSP